MKKENKGGDESKKKSATKSCCLNGERKKRKKGKNRREKAPPHPQVVFYRCEVNNRGLTEGECSSRLLNRSTVGVRSRSKDLNAFSSSGRIFGI